MKRITLVSMIMLCGLSAEPIINIAQIIDRPAKTSRDLFGKPYLTGETFACWEKGDRPGWDWSITFKDGKSIFSVIEIPKPYRKKSIREIPNIFGFSSDQGWASQGPFQYGSMTSFVLTHPQRGRVRCKIATDESGEISAVVFDVIESVDHN